MLACRRFGFPSCILNRGDSLNIAPRVKTWLDRLEHGQIDIFRPEKGLDVDQLLETTAKAIIAARHPVALTGAGISAESGIPPFRGPGGLWTKHGEPPMNGFSKFLADPAAAWAERLSPRGPLKELSERIGAARPNPGHMALAEMEREGRLHCLITQNIDNLHTLAGSRRVIEIHGNARLVRCLTCVRRRPIDEISMAPLPPLCEDCGGLLKIDTVSFGEPIPPDVLTLCESESTRCDCMLVVGTSATVYPAASFPIDVKRRGGILIEVNLHESELTEHCAISLRGAAGLVLPAIAQRLKSARTVRT